MNPRLFGEFMGTAVLILMGNGVVANVLLRKSKGEGAGWMVIATGWGFAVMCGIFTAIACGDPDAHLNPAVTFGVAVRSGDFSNFGPYVAAQMAGAMLGAFSVWLHYLPHWRETPDAEARRACFCTSPAIRHIPCNLLSEIVGTFVLVFVAGAIGSKAVATSGQAGAGMGAGLGPYLVSCLIWGIGLSLGGTTGYAINPARDLGPRIVHAILPIAKKAPSDWGYAPVPILGPLIGAALAGVLMRWAL
jgi:glycerol uptake facilitator protein